MLIGAELSLSLLAVGGSVEEHFANYGQAAPLIGLLGQLAFAAFPLLRHRRHPGRVEVEILTALQWREG